MIKFTKMQGLGNDYVYMDAIHQKIENESSLAQFVSDRHFGVGSDGLILICKSDIADFKMRMFNSDGTEAGMCGNGIRCVGKFLYDKGLTKKLKLNIETLSGIKILNLSIGKDNKVSRVMVDMGKPSENSKKEIVINDEIIKLKCVSVGNPHAITIVDNVDNIDIKKYGPIIENDASFPQKTNVEFVQILNNRNIKMRVWERGTGETLACGTGACASAVICMLERYTLNDVYVHLLGGILHIMCNRVDNHIYMAGPATTVYEGKIIL